MTHKRKGHLRRASVYADPGTSRYVCTRAAASLGLFHIMAVGTVDVRLVQVKAGGDYVPNGRHLAVLRLRTSARVSLRAARSRSGAGARSSPS